ncbi:polysialyltransferase family glycosyltransferase [Streptomyces sp. KR2]|uniref:polysialyltransferase family glycosyltransferase n=1 Tax=Streptomyces sp. KR2 TaxID=1514824 RepID=UPI003F7DA8B8
MNDAPAPAGVRPGSTQLFLAATQYAAATVVAALRAGRFGPRAGHRRVLVVSDTSAVPEVGTPLDAMPGFAALAGEFDAVHSWNAFVHPFHPAGWSPREQDCPLWERAVREAWQLGDGPLEVACESLQANPSQAVVRIFSDAPVHLYADGLMSYGPTRSRLDPLIGTRVARLLHLDLVPGLRPLLLGEFGVEPEVVPTEEFVKVLGELAEDPASVRAADAAGAVGAGSPALLLGQYLSAIEVLTPDEEERLHLRLLRGAAALGHRDIVFKPHPSAPAGWTRALTEEADRLGVRFGVLDEPVLAEVVFQRLRPALVAGCFSTALLTAAVCYGLPVARTGTDLLLERLTPYQNSNRVPVTLVDALLPALEDGAAVAAWTAPGTDGAGLPEGLAELVATVGFAMQPALNPQLRPVAERHLARLRHTPALGRYFKRRRLTALALPGGVPERLAFVPRNRAVRGLARRARRLSPRLAKAMG